MLSNELRDQQEGKATRWAAFFDFQRAVAPCLNGCLFPTALISSCLNCRSLGGAEICLVSKRMFIPDGTPVLVTEYYILTRRNIETLNMVVCSATNVESCSCRRALKAWQKVRLRRWGRKSARRAANEKGSHGKAKDTLKNQAYRNRWISWENRNQAHPIINSADFYEDYVVVDDNQPVYQVRSFDNLSLYPNMRVENLAVPLYKRMFLDAPDATSTIQSPSSVSFPSLSPGERTRK